MNGLQLSSMDVADMLDVIHYIFEDDMINVVSGEHVEAKDKVRTIIYRDYYDSQYKYSSSNSTVLNDKIASEELTKEDIEDITPFDPASKTVKPYMPPTDFDEQSLKPFGRDIDAPMGQRQIGGGGVAVIGDAYVVIHAITSGVKKEVQEGFRGVEKEGEAAGKKVAQSFSKGFNGQGMGSNTPIANSLSSMFGTTTKDAIKAADAFKIATQTGYFMGSALTAAGGAVGALGNGLVSLVGVALAAAPAMAKIGRAHV